MYAKVDKHNTTAKNLCTVSLVHVTAGRYSTAVLSCTLHIFTQQIEIAVSYTHLDVYKRQVCVCVREREKEREREK